MNSTFWIIVVLCGAAAALAGHLLASRRVLIIGKVTASSGFVACAYLLAGFDDPTSQVLFVALLFCWLGDVLLLSDKQRIFLLGLLSFLLGHICFCLGFLAAQPEIRSSVVAFALLTMVAAKVYRWLMPHVPAELKIPVLAYLVVIAMMAVLSVGITVATGDLRIVSAASIFCISDIAVARDRFIKKENINQVIIVPLYFSAQVLFALSINFAAIAAHVK